jgi:SPP1 family predicted phage head-tail adaptor
VRIGKMNKRVEFQKRLEVQADSGEVTFKYATLEQRWVYIKPLSGREFFAAQQESNSVSTEIGTRYVPHITEKMRIVYTPDSSRPTFVEIYTIEAVIHEQMNRRETRFMCTKQIVEGFKRDGSDA